MVRALLTVTVLAFLAGCGRADDPAPRPQASAAAAAPADAVLAVWNEAKGSELFWADGATLEPVNGRSLAFSYFYSVAERSPDGGTLALGAGERGYVQLVDLERMRSLGTLDLGAGEFVERLHWTAPDRLLVSLGGLPGRAAALDPATGDVLSSPELDGTILVSSEAGDDLVFLLAPSEGIGPARVARFDGRSVRVAELSEIRAGWEQVGEVEEDYRARQVIPALAVDPAGTRALVVPAGNRVGEVDLRSMEVSYHDLSEPVSLLGRLRDWLEPAAEAKLIDGPERNAVWLTHGLVAVSGAQYAADGDDLDVTPAGLALIDPDDWSVRRVSEEPNWVELKGGALLAAAWPQDGGSHTLIVSDPDGTERFTLVRGSADVSQVSGEHLYVASGEGRRYEIVDLVTGATVGRATPGRPTWLVQTGD